MVKHPALAIFHKRGESFMHDCQECGHMFHTCGDNPEARCSKCRKPAIAKARGA